MTSVALYGRTGLQQRGHNNVSNPDKSRLFCVRCSVCEIRHFEIWRCEARTRNAQIQTLLDGADASFVSSLFYAHVKSCALDA